MLQNGTPAYTAMRLQEIADELNQIIQLYEGLLEGCEDHPLGGVVEELLTGCGCVEEASALLDQRDWDFPGASSGDS